MPKNTPTDHPPAHFHGIPKAGLRFGVRWLAIMLASVVVWMVGALILIRVLPTTVLIRVVYLLIGSIVVLSLAWLPLFTVRFNRLRNQVVNHPDACLNCAYETVDPTTHICPECAHHSDRAALNRFWLRSIKADASQTTPAAEHEPAVVGGIPKIGQRFFFRWVSIVYISTMLVIALIPVASLVGPFPSPLWFLPAIPIVLITLITLMALRYRALQRRLRTNPDACLNCGYETVHAHTRVCPECAHVSDRAELSRNWTRAINPLNPPSPQPPAHI
ncbi:MAG: hypothetical protein LAT64_14145 [Phycisphaerales bacterium]|nr:hypothetical protein [Planctomycetota bacterium]MCH8509892.1 hypothetical protein [Phycisphaerales bacterium]